MSAVAFPTTSLTDQTAIPRRIHIQEKTLDDLLRACIEQINVYGQKVVSTKKDSKEIFGVLLELENPRARLSLTESKGKIFSCLGELTWYLSGSNELKHIEYYISVYPQYSDDEKTLYGAYGPRIFSMRGINQFGSIVDLLKRKRSSRQAVIQIFNAEDIKPSHKTEDVPCTCLMQFSIRPDDSGQDTLHMIVYMRSNDVFVGLPHDIFSFTVMQELLARELGVELGTYKHTVGSLHIYDTDKEKTEQYLDEGYQSTDITMPPMPQGSQSAAVAKLLEIEKILREQGTTKIEINDLDPYWADLARVLEIYAISKKATMSKGEQLRQWSQIKKSMHFPIYIRYLQRRADRLRQPKGQVRHMMGLIYAAIRQIISR